MTRSSLAAILAALFLTACTGHAPPEQPRSGPVRQALPESPKTIDPPPQKPGIALAPEPPAGPPLIERGDVRAWVASVAARRRLDSGALQRAFGAAYSQPGVLAAIAKPYEAKPWYAYRKLFITETRIKNGRDFMQRNAAALARAEQRFGVSPSIVTAIIGIESAYGQNPGKYRVLEALATLGFDYPKRSSFFLKELEEFLVLTRNEGFDPLMPVGSYAGAMGMPQFMPSSYRGYAADGDGDGKRDIWNNPADAIASVARYFSANGWRHGEMVAVPAVDELGNAGGLVSKSLKPNQDLDRLESLGIRPAMPVLGQATAAVIGLEEESGPAYWLGFHNFYVITRYNHSPLYAMAAHELSLRLRDRSDSRQ